jgi:phage baseplate assembly protein W
MAKAFSIEDGNLAQIPITSSRTRLYKDLDLEFLNRPSGDIYKKTDAAAVKQAIKNLLMTNRFEKPFRPNFGGGLNEFLFSLSTEFDEIDIQERIFDVITSYEPRAAVQKVNVTLLPDNNSINVTVAFQVISTREVVELTLSLVRLR